eukprot:scaffold5653_cov147-Cylindrotheca_fusiformis.AAC.4
MAFSYNGFYFFHSLRFPKVFVLDRHLMGATPVDYFEFWLRDKLLSKSAVDTKTGEIYLEEDSLLLATYVDKAFEPTPVMC